MRRMRREAELEGGLSRQKRPLGFSKKKASQKFRPQIFKNHDDLCAEQEAARKRWAGEPPIVVVRQIIAEVELPEGRLADFMEMVGRADSRQLAASLHDGSLVKALAEFATAPSFFKKYAQYVRKPYVS